MNVGLFIPLSTLVQETGFLVLLKTFTATRGKIVRRNVWRMRTRHRKN